MFIFACKFEPTQIKISGDMVASSTHVYQLSSLGTLTITFDHDKSVLELSYESHHNGRRFARRADLADLRTFPLLALDLEVLTDAIERKPDVVTIQANNTIWIGWKIPVGIKRKDLTFVLQYVIVPGSTEIEQRDRDFIKSLAHRVDVLEHELKQEKKNNRVIKKQVEALTATIIDVLTTTIVDLLFNLCSVVSSCGISGPDREALGRGRSNLSLVVKRRFPAIPIENNDSDSESLGNVVDPPEYKTE